MKERVGEVALKNLVQKFGSPLYVYDAAIIRSRIAELIKAFPYQSFIVQYAMKANSNPTLLKIVKETGVNIEAVSIGEVDLALNAGFGSEQIVFTCSNVASAELREVTKRGVYINVDSIRQLEKLANFKYKSAVSIRINQGIGSGHHSHVITGGPNSKFGIDVTDIPKALSIAKKAGIRISGIQQHIGSNVLDEKTYIKAVRVLLETADKFPDLENLDIGGGIGVPYKPEEKKFPLTEIGEKVVNLVKGYNQAHNKQLKLAIEPGRFIVAESGMLLVTVTEVKKTPYRVFVGVDSGFNHLIRPAMYDSYHEIINLSRPRGKKIKVTIAGNICESGDVFARDREVAMPIEGDILAILNAGAYGYAMSSNYNSRLKPREILIDGSKAKLIRERL